MLSGLFRSSLPPQLYFRHRLARHLSSSMSSMSSGVTELDRASFSSTLSLLSVKIRKESCTLYQKFLKGYLFERPRMKKIYDVPDEPDSRYILLKESETLSELPKHITEFIDEKGDVLGPYELHLGYENLSVDEVLKTLLPDSCEIPSSFEQVGHLAHMNLRDDVLKFKYIIGQVILDKNPKLRTVVNKIGNIETEFRTFPMEVLAGVEDFDVAVKESGATFRFNFKDVYWNSRLGTEHNRIITALIQAENVKHTTSAQNLNALESQLKSSLGKRSLRAMESKIQLPVIADMMGGVGPFSVPLGKSRVYEVHCNDLNPASYNYMVKNGVSNNCSPPFLSCYNMCGRKFISTLQGALNERNISVVRPIEHVLMNLPQSATDFLDVFIGFNTRRNDENLRIHLPIIHVYAFSTCVDTPHTAVSDIAQRCADVMQCHVSLLGAQQMANSSNSNFILLMQQQHTTAPEAPICFGHIVRNVSPKKVMVCLSFRLPKAVADRECVI